MTLSNSLLRDLMIRLTNDLLNKTRNMDNRVNERLDIKVSESNNKLYINNHIISNSIISNNIVNNTLNNNHLGKLNDLTMTNKIILNDKLYTDNIDINRRIARLSINSNVNNNENYIIFVNNKEPKNLYISYFEFIQNIESDSINNSVEFKNSGLERIFNGKNSIEKLKESNLYLYIFDTNISIINGNIDNLKLIGYNNKKNITKIDNYKTGTYVFTFEENIINYNINEESIIINAELFLIDYLFEDNKILTIGNSNIKQEIISKNNNIGNDNTSISNIKLNAHQINFRGSSFIINVDKFSHKNMNDIRHTNMNITDTLNVPNINTEVINFRHIPYNVKWYSENSDTMNLTISIKNNNLIELIYIYNNHHNSSLDLLLEELRNNNLYITNINQLIGYKLYLTDNKPSDITNPLKEENNIIIKEFIISSETSSVNSLNIKVDSNVALLEDTINYSGVLNFVYQNNNIELNSDVEFNNDLIINGNLFVDRVGSTKNVDNLTIYENFLLLNGNVSGLHTPDSGILINSENINPQLIWNHDNRYFDINNNNLRVNHLSVNILKNINNLNASTTIFNTKNYQNNSGFNNLIFLSFFKARQNLFSRFSNREFITNILEIDTLSDIMNNYNINSPSFAIFFLNERFTAMQNKADNFITNNYIFKINNVINRHGSVWGSLNLSMNFIYKPSWIKETFICTQLNINIPIRGNNNIEFDSISYNSLDTSFNNWTKDNEESNQDRIKIVNDFGTFFNDSGDPNIILYIIRSQDDELLFTPYIRMSYDKTPESVRGDTDNYLSLSCKTNIQSIETIYNIHYNNNNIIDTLSE